MANCTFLGHRDCPDSIKPKLRKVLLYLIENHDVNLFYVGNQGHFDRIVRSVLRELGKEYHQVNYAVVLAYPPQGRNVEEDLSDTMLPEGVESVHPRYAVSWRNNWMLRRSDYVVTYITHSWGGAAQYAKKAEQSGKVVINVLSEIS